MQAAYLAGEESGDMTTAFKGKEKALPQGKGKSHKGKGFGKAKGKGYGKGPGKKGFKSRPGDYPWKIDERSWRNSRRKQNAKLVGK